MTQEYPLIEQLYHYGLEFLIPERLDQDEEYRNSRLKCYDPLEDAYYDQFLFDSSDDESDDDYLFNDAEYGIVKYAYEDSDSTLYNLDDLIELFDRDYQDPEEVLNTNLWTLFGVTKNQFDLIDWNSIPREQFVEFYDTFRNDFGGYPIEKRILYSTAQIFTGFLDLQWCHGSECSVRDMREYLERLVDTHSVDDVQQYVSWLRDYYAFYPDALVMNARREAEGEAILRYTVRPKPSHIKDLHDKAFRDHQAMETERAAMDRKGLNYRIDQISKLRSYSKNLFKGTEYVILPVTCQEDLDKEGQALHHCVAYYGSEMAAGRSYIYLVRRVEDTAVPYFTIEVKPANDDTGNKKQQLTQCYTTHDTITKPSSLREFIKGWAKEKDILIRCKL